MRLNQILTEAEQQEIEMLQEGPLGSLAKAAATGVGKAVGGVAKGVGAVAGGIAGIGKAFKKGFSAGKKTVGGDDEEETGTTASGGSTAGGSGGTTKATSTEPTSGQTAQPATGTAAQPAANATPAQQPAAAAPAAKTQKPAAAQKPTAAAPTAGAAQQDGAVKDTAYAQAQKALQGLQPEQQKEIYNMLIADPKVKAALEKPAATSADFDPEFGVPITPAGVASYAKYGAKANAKKADAAMAAGWTHDGQTGIWSPPGKPKAKTSTAPVRKTGAVKIGAPKPAAKPAAKTAAV